MPLYRISYVADSQARSVLRELAIRPEPGDVLVLDPDTVISVQEVLTRPEGDTITAEIVAQVVPAPVAGVPRPTGSGSRSSN